MRLTAPGAARAAADVVHLAASRPARNGRRVIGIEGRSGSGKTTFAEAVADAVRALTGTRPPVLHMDSLYPGWDGLARSTNIVAEALAARPVTYPTWDWAASEPGPTMTVVTGDWLVVEGIGCGAAVVRPHLTALVWLDADPAVRKQRALDRDGELYAPHWHRWADQEEALLAGDDIRAAADLHLTT